MSGWAAVERAQAASRGLGDGVVFMTGFAVGVLACCVVVMATVLVLPL